MAIRAPDGANKHAEIIKEKEHDANGVVDNDDEKEAKC